MSKHCPKGEDLFHKTRFLQTWCTTTCRVRSDSLLAQQKVCFHKKLSTIKCSHESISCLYHSLNSQSVLTADQTIVFGQLIKIYICCMRPPDVQITLSHLRSNRWHSYLYYPCSMTVNSSYDSFDCVGYKLGQQQQYAKYETKPVVTPGIWKKKCAASVPICTQSFDLSAFKRATIKKTKGNAFYETQWTDFEFCSGHKPT